MLTIGVDARAAAEVPAGRGRYVRELCRAWDRCAPADVRFVLYARRAWDGVSSSAVRWRTNGAPDPAWHLWAARSASRECDVFLSTNSYLSAWFTTIPTAVVVHDLSVFAPGIPANRKSVVVERLTMTRAVRRAQALVCDSSATRAELVAKFPAAADRAVAVPLAASLPTAGTAPPPPERPFVLAVGTLEPRKNLRRLLQAWHLLPEPLRTAHRLVLVGPTGWDVGELFDEVRSSTSDVHLTGHISDAELVDLYATCAAFCYPSLHEGFGLPVLEALSLGAPVVTSRVAALTEVAGDAALFVDPLDAASICEGLRTVLSDDDLAARLRSGGPRRAAAFSWELTAERTLAALRSIAPADAGHRR